MIYKTDLIKDNILSSGSRTLSVLQLAKVIKADNTTSVEHQPDMSYHIFLVYDSQMNLIFSPVSITKVLFDGESKQGKRVL